MAATPPALTPEAALAWLQRRGLSVTLKPTGDKLILTGPSSARTEKVRAYLRDNRDALIACLAQGESIESPESVQEQTGSCTGPDRATRRGTSRRLPRLVDPPPLPGEGEYLAREHEDRDDAPSFLDEPAIRPASRLPREAGPIERLRRAARSNALPRLTPMLRLPSGRLVGDPNPFVRGARAGDEPDLAALAERISMSTEREAA